MSISNAFLKKSPQPTLITASGAGNYTIPTGAVYLWVDAQAAGGPGASARRGAVGTVRCGGGPGGTGSFVRVMVLVSDILAQYPTGVVPYNVGASGAGGAAVLTNDTNGNPGSAVSTAVNGTYLGTIGTPTSFALATPGQPGAGGTATSGTGGNLGAPSMVWLANAGAASAASTLGGPGVAGFSAISSPGGGITNTNVPGAGGNGQNGALARPAVGTGGVVDAAIPTAGTAALNGPGAGSGGGAASITTASQAGADGGANTGCGGGGGGASLNGNIANKGGDSGSGYLRIVAVF